MTTENNDALGNLFTRYGSQSNDAEIRIWGHLTRAEAIDERDRLLYYDREAERLINTARTLIATMTEYRATLAERFNYLDTSPTIPVVRLIREKKYTGKVFYYLQTFRRNLLDNHEVQSDSISYPGTERAKAIADYKAYIKSHPGITAEMKIEKSKWER